MINYFKDYFNFHFWGMHLLWWLLGMILIIWIFAIPYNIPGQRAKKDSPLHILKKRFANGQIDKFWKLKLKTLEK
jgi:putative membrane protein